MNLHFIEMLFKLERTINPFLSTEPRFFYPVLCLARILAPTKRIWFEALISVQFWAEIFENFCGWWIPPPPSPIEN